MDEMTLDELVAAAYEAQQKINEAKKEYNHYQTILIDALPANVSIDSGDVTVRVAVYRKVNADAMRTHFPPDKHPELWHAVPNGLRDLDQRLTAEELDLFVGPRKPTLYMRPNEKGRSK